MKKLLLILLCLFTFSNVFASSQYSRSDRVYGGIIGAFNFLFASRNKGSNDPAVDAKRKRAEALLKKDFNGEYRNHVLAAYAEKKNEIENGLYQDKLSGDQNEIKKSTECLNELLRINKIIGIK